MSFKREGDDGSQLNVLRKRRVADLLASFIPEDEALLLKNGRYACAVCHHRPVFDTIDMLSIHRSGKKHVAGLQSFYGKKTEFRNEVQKRQHRERVRAEEAGEQHPQGPAPLIAQTRRITHHALLKSAPYNSCCSRRRPGDSGKGIGSPELCAPPPSSVMSQTSQPVGEWPPPPDTAAAYSEPGGSTAVPHTEPETQKILGHRKKSRRRAGEGETPSEDPDKTREMEHYLRLRSAGWIPDGTGKWVKDENVEFDSDEEEPPPMPPP